jgi:hypothetical protein
VGVRLIPPKVTPLIRLLPPKATPLIRLLPQKVTPLIRLIPHYCTENTKTTKNKSRKQEYFYVKWVLLLRNKIFFIVLTHGLWKNQL